MSKKMGRPGLPKNQVRKVFPIRLSKDERVLIEKAAAKAKEKATSWARKVLLEKAVEK